MTGLMVLLISKKFVRVPASRDTSRAMFTNGDIGSQNRPSPCFDVCSETRL